jgi:hypothetical protein
VPFAIAPTHLRTYALSSQTQKSLAAKKSGTSKILTRQVSGLGRERMSDLTPAVQRLQEKFYELTGLTD